MSPLPEPLISRLQESKSLKVFPRLQSKATGTISPLGEDSKSLITLESPKSRRYKSSTKLLQSPRAKPVNQMTENDVIQEIGRALSSPAQISQNLQPRPHIYVPKTKRMRVSVRQSGSTLLQPTTITEEPSLEEMGVSNSLQSRMFNISERKPAKTLPMSPRSTNANYGLPYAEKIKNIKSRILSPKSLGPLQLNQGSQVTLPQIKEEKQSVKLGRVFQAIPTAVFIGEEGLASEGACSTVRRSRSSIDLEVKLKEMGSSQHEFMRQRNSSQVLIKKLSGRKIQIHQECDGRNSSSNNTQEFKIQPLKDKRRGSVDSKNTSKTTKTRIPITSPKGQIQSKQKRTKAFELTAKVLGQKQTERIEKKLAEWEKMQQLLKYNEATKKRQERKEKSQTLTTHHIHTSFNIGTLKEVQDSREKPSQQSSHQDSNDEPDSSIKNCTNERTLEINAQNRTRTVFSELVNEKPNQDPKNFHQRNTQQKRPDSRLGAASNSYYSGRSRLSSPCGTVSGHVLQARLDNQEIPSTFTFGVRETRTGEIVRIPSEEAMSYFQKRDEQPSAGVFGALMKTKLFEFGRVRLQSLTPKAALRHVLLQKVPPEVLYEKIQELPDHKPITWQTINELADQLLTFQDEKEREEVIWKIQKQKLPEMDPTTGWPKDILQKRGRFLEEREIHLKRKKMREIQLRKQRQKLNLEAFIKYRVLFPLVRKVLYEQSYEEQEEIREDIELMLWQLGQRLGFETSYTRSIEPSSKRKESQLGRLRNAMQRKLGLEKSLIFDSDQDAFVLVQHGHKYGNADPEESSEHIEDPEVLKSQTADQYVRNYQGEESEDQAIREYSDRDQSESSDSSSLLGGERSPHSRTRNSALRIAGTQTSHGGRRKASSTRNHQRVRQFTEVRTRSLPLESDQVSNFIRSFNRSSLSQRKRSLYLTHSSSKDQRDREQLMQLPSTTRQVINIDLPSSADFPEPDEPILARRPSSADQEGSPARYRNYQIKGKYVFLEGRPILLRKASHHQRTESLSRNQDSFLQSSQHSSSRSRQRMSVSLNLDRMKWNSENDTNRKSDANESNSGEDDDEDRYLNIHISPNIVIQKPEEPPPPQFSSNSQISTFKPTPEKKEYRRSTFNRQSTFSEESSMLFDKNKTLAQLSDELSHESDDAGEKRRGKIKKKIRPRGKTVAIKMTDWKQQRNKLIKGIKLVSQLSELSQGEDVLTQGDLTLQELVFKQTKRQEKRKKMKDIKKSLESSQNSTITQLKHSHSAEPNFKSPVQNQPRLSLFVISREPELQEIKAQTIRDFDEGHSLREEPELSRSKSKGENRSKSPPKRQGRPTLMTGEKMLGFEAARNKVEEHFSIIKKRLLQLNKEKFYSLLQSLPKNKPPTQKLVNRALDKIEGTQQLPNKKFKILSQNTVRVGDSLLEDEEQEQGEQKSSPRKQGSPDKQQDSSPKRISKIPATVKKGLHKVQFIAACKYTSLLVKVMKKKRSKQNLQEQERPDPGFNKLKPAIDLSAIVEKAPPQEIAPSPLHDGHYLSSNSFFNQNELRDGKRSLSVMLGSAGSGSRRNQSFYTIPPGDVLFDENGNKTIFIGDLRFRDFNRTNTSADIMGQIKMNFAENVIRKSVQNNYDEEVSLEVESEVKEELDRRSLFKIHQEKILLKQRAIRRNQAVVRQVKVQKMGGFISTGTAEKKAAQQERAQMDQLKVLPPPRSQPYTQMDEQRSRHIKSSSFLESNTDGSQRGNILISIGDQEQFPQKKLSDGTLIQLKQMIREVERQTDVGEGGLNALKCDLVAKSMEKSHSRMLKNLQKLEQFTMKSRMLAGTPKLQTVSTIQADQDSKRAGSLFDPVIEAKVEETERTPKRQNLQDQLTAFVNSEDQFSDNQVIPKLKMPPEQLRQKIKEYNEQVQELEKVERKYCVLSGKKADYLKTKTKPLIKDPSSMFEMKGLAELLSTPLSAKNIRTNASRQTQERKFRERVASLPTLQNVGSLPDQFKSDQKLHRQFSSTLISNRPTTTATNRLLYDPYRKTYRASTQNLISTSRPNSQGFFSTEAGSTTGGWLSHIQSPSAHNFEQTLRITSTAQTGFRSHMKSSKGFGSTAKSEKKVYPQVHSKREWKKKTVSRKMGAWY